MSSMSNRPSDPSDDRPDAFEPGPSFADEPVETPGDADTLPSWLQNFAETVQGDGPRTDGNASMPGTGELAQPGSVLPPVEMASEPGLPGWLDDAPSAPLPTGPSFDALPSASVDSAAVSGVGDSTGFLSDDDLPEWLRSLGPNAPTVANSDPLEAMARPAMAATLTVPSVARVWVTPHEQAPQPPSAELFASIASVLDERPDTVVSEAPAQPPLPVSTMPIDQPVIAPTTVTPVSRPSNGRWSRKELWLAVAFILLSVVMLAILMWLQS
jgi:hypothetical protein